MVSKEFNNNSRGENTTVLSRRLAIIPRDNYKMKINSDDDTVIVDNLLSRKGPLTFTMFPKTKETASSTSPSPSPSLLSSVSSCTSKTGSNLYNFSIMSSSTTTTSTISIRTTTTATGENNDDKRINRRYPRHNTYPLPSKVASSDDTYPLPSKVATRVASRRTTKRSSYRYYEKINDSLRNVLVNMSTDFVLFDEDEEKDEDSEIFFLDDNDKEEEKCVRVRQRYSAYTLRHKIGQQYQQRMQQRQEQQQDQQQPKEQLVPKE